MGFLHHDTNEWVAGMTQTRQLFGACQIHTFGRTQVFRGGIKSGRTLLNCGAERLFVAHKRSAEKSVNQIKRSFNELTKYLIRCQTFPHGAVLLTGTGIVPAADFTLRPKDRVRIAISGVGVLENSVVTV